MNKIKRYNKINGLQNAIYNHTNPPIIKIKNVIMELVPVFWNNSNSYVDVENFENYININEYGDITRVSINDLYWDNQINACIEDI